MPTDQPVFVKEENPFAGLSRAEIDAMFTSAGERYVEEYITQLASLKSLITPLNRLHLTSLLAVHGLSRGVTDLGEIQERDEKTTVQQSHVELLQALALAVPPSSSTTKAAHPQTIQQVWDALMAVADAFARKRYSQMAKTSNPEERAVLGFQEWLRLHTQYVRHWASFGQANVIIRELYGPLDEIYRTATGVSATEFISIFHALFKIIETRINERWRRLRAVFRAKTVPGLIASYSESVGESSSDAERLLGFATSKNLTVENVRVIIFSHNDLDISSVHTFQPEEVAKMSGVSVDTVRTGLSRLAIVPGELQEGDIDLYFLDNPVWRRPVVQLGANLFYCPLPQIFFDGVHGILEGLLPTAEKEALSQRRAAFLERKIQDDFVAAFPGSAVQPSVKWKDGVTEYECDLLCRVDAYLFVIEAKSGFVSAPALRGAPKRMRKHIDELLIEPSLQSYRLTARLSEKLARKLKPDFFSEPLLFELTGVEHVVRLSVTLEDFATLQTRIEDLRTTGWIPADLTLAATMSLADLETVFDILNGPIERIHYIVRRGELSRQLRTLGDELDWLGLYLKTSFILGKIEEHDGAFVISGMSKEIDAYLSAIDAGRTPNRPALKRTKLWNAISEQMGKRAFVRWTEAAVMLLNISESNQKGLELEFKEREKEVRRDSRGKEDKNAMICIPAENAKDAFAMIALKTINYHRRHEIVQNIANRVFEKNHVQRVLVLVRNVDTSDYPYSMLAVLERDEVG
jgi:hypothetical protein